MITFFILLVVLMVLVVAAGTWAAGPRRRVYYDRGPLVDRTTDVIEEDRIVRRRRTL